MQKRLRQSFAALLLGVGLAVALVPAAYAQSTWGGTTSTGDYNTATEWTPAIAPVAGGQLAIFDAAGPDTVNVSAAIAPDVWIFNTSAQSYSISGANVTFTANGGILNNANAGQFIGIFNNIGAAGATVSQNGASTLILSGINTYTGGTSITGGTLQVTNNSSVGSGAVLLNRGTFQTNGVTNLTFTNQFQVGAFGGTVDVNGTTLTLSGDISGPGTLNVTDSSFSFSTAVLSGNNSGLTGLTVTGARVVATNNNSLAGTTVTLDNGALQAGAAGLTFFQDFKLNAGGGILDSNGNTLSIAGNISDGNGPGALTIIDSTGGGITELAGTNTYSGGTTVINTTLQVTNNASVGTGTVTLDEARFQTDGLGGNLTFTNNFQINNSASGSIIDASGVVLTIAGNISDGIGAGKLTIDDRIGGGSVVLLGNNTYTGGTEICICATLQLGDATHTASLVGAITNFGALYVVNANLSGVTSLTNDGGLASFLNGTSAGSMAINNINNALLSFGGFGGTDTATAGNSTITNDGSSVVFFANTSAGNANIYNINGGQLYFGTPGGTETATAGNATIVNNASFLVFAANTNAGTANITNVNGLMFFLDQASAGSATIANYTATLEFGTPFGSDTPTAGNATIINYLGGLTEFNARSTAGNAKITTYDGGETHFFDNSDGGTAQFITVGTGFVDFSGSLGPNGDGRIHAGSIEGSGIYYIGAGNTLVVGGNNLSTTLSGVIADYNPSPGCGCPPIPGIGNFEKEGTGNLILSGINTYTGTTTVNGGKLTVNGSIASSSGTTVNSGGTLTVNGVASSVTVNAGGTLGGNGVVGNTTFNGGALAPGNSIGLLTVQGSLVMSAATTYMVEISPTNADRTNVTGTATLGGATVNASFASGTYSARQYTILNAAGGVSGTFNPVVASPGSNFQAKLSYDVNNVYLNLSLSFGAGLNTNQQNVANAVVNQFNSGGAVSSVFANLTPGGLSQVSGELATGSQQSTFDAMNIFLGLITDPFVAGRDGGISVGGSAASYAPESGSYAEAAKNLDAAHDAFAKMPTKAEAARNNLFNPGWSVWGAPFGGGASTSGNAALGSNNATAREFGFAAGADYRFSPSTLAGFALAGGGTNFSVSGFGSGRSDLFQAGVFVRHTIGAAYVTGALAYGWQDVTTDRTVTIAGVDRLRAEFKANAWSGRVEGGYRFATPWMGITPYAAGQFTTYSLPAYAEQVLSGSNNFALSYAAKDVTASRSELGLRSDKSFAMQNGILTLRGRAAWAHDFNTDRNVTALFQTLPGAAFVVNGAAQARDSALATTSIEMKWLNGWSAAATFEGQFSSVTNSYAGKGVVRYAW